MKKLLSAAAAVLALAMAFTGCSHEPAGPKTVECTVERYPIEFAENVYDGGANYQIVTPAIIPANVRLNAGDTVLIHFKGVFDKTVTGLQMTIVDNTEPAGWWLTLCDAVDVADEVVKGEDFSFDVEIPVTVSQKGTGADAHKVQINYDYDVGEVATIYEPGTDVDNLVDMGKELLAGDISNNGNVITVADLEGYVGTYNTITFTIKNDNAADRTGWGVLKLMATDAEDPWTWHGGILAGDEYGQLAGPTAFASGATYEYTFSITEVVEALKAEIEAKECDVKHQLTAQVGNGAVLTSVKLTQVDPA